MGSIQQSNESAIKLPRLSGTDALHEAFPSFPRFPRLTHLGRLPSQAIP